jgi:hypothetical protein
MAGNGGYTPPRITSAQFFIEETVLKVKGWLNYEHFYLFYAHNGFIRYLQVLVVGGAVHHTQAVASPTPRIHTYMTVIALI